MEIVKYEVNQAAIAKMANIYLNLSIDGIDDKDGYSDVHSARMIMVKHRTSIDKLRKATNNDAQEFINNNNKNAKKLLSSIAPIEEHLKSEENKITQEKKRIQEENERIEQERVKKRVDALLNIEVIMSYTEVVEITDDEYESLFKNAKKIFDDKKAKAAEEKRLIAEEKRLIAEAEKRLDIERADIERVRLEQEKIAKTQADKDRKIEEKKQSEIKQKEREEFERISKEKAIIDAEKKAKERIEIEMRNRRIEVEEFRTNALGKIGFFTNRPDLGTMTVDQFENMYNTAKEKYDKKQEIIIAEKIEKERIEKEKAESIEKKRIEEIKPDKEKILQYAKRLTSIIGPDLKNSKAISIILFAESELNTIAENIIMQLDEL